METRLEESRAQFIANVCRNNTWMHPMLEDKGISIDEWSAFVDYAIDGVNARDQRELEEGAVDIEVEFISNSYKINQDDEKWTVLIPHKYGNAVLAVAGNGKVRATLMPSVLRFDADTGEMLL